MRCLSTNTAAQVTAGLKGEAGEPRTPAPGRKELSVAPHPHLSPTWGDKSG